MSALVLTPEISIIICNTFIRNPSERPVVSSFMPKSHDAVKSFSVDPRNLTGVSRNIDHLAFPRTSYSQLQADLSPCRHELMILDDQCDRRTITVAIVRSMSSPGLVIADPHQRCKAIQSGEFWRGEHAHIIVLNRREDCPRQVTTHYPASLSETSNVELRDLHPCTSQMVA